MLNTTELGLEFPEGDFRSIFNSEKRLDVTIAVLVGRGQGFQGRRQGCHCCCDLSLSMPKALM